MTNQLWQRRDTWVGTQVEDQLVMINIDAGDYVALNGSAVSHCGDGNLDTGELCDPAIAGSTVCCTACCRSACMTLASNHKNATAMVSRPISDAPVSSHSLRDMLMEFRKDMDASSQKLG